MHKPLLKTPTPIRSSYPLSPTPGPATKYARGHRQLSGVKQTELLQYQRLLRIPDWEALASQAHFRPFHLSVLVGLSLRHLERFFRDVMGKSPRRWLRELQCEKARQLIQNGYSTKAAAEEAGFSSSAVLCHQFKRTYGHPPQSFVPSPK